MNISAYTTDRLIAADATGTESKKIKVTEDTLAKLEAFGELSFRLSRLKLG